jgi:glycine cleavage system aminomethyltransferase T
MIKITGFMVQRALNGRMIEFFGWEMPVEYKGKSTSTWPSAPPRALRCQPHGEIWCGKDALACQAPDPERRGWLAAN